jgi:hypothetical protein
MAAKASRNWQRRHFAAQYLQGSPKLRSVLGLVMFALIATAVLLIAGTGVRALLHRFGDDGPWDEVTEIECM